MFTRPFWQERILAAWRQAPIVWLCGVRRSGKTTLARSLEDQGLLYVNCDLPATEDRVRDPELFYRSCGQAGVIFDEVHQLRDPSRLLKIGADLFPEKRILATGSSTLGASSKFSDTLTGRKRNVHLTPVLWEELETFGVTLPTRLYHGGLPQALLADRKSAAFFREWLDSYFARDLQRLFGLRDIQRFTAFIEYALRHSGGQFEVAKAARTLGIARPTVESHLRALETTKGISLIRPYHGGNLNEITKLPKLYAFDTGFVSFARGWDPLRQEDLGLLWEHLVLEQLQARFPETPVRYWRDKRGREVDFVMDVRRDQVMAIECKWDSGAFDSAGLRAFREQYPQGSNHLVVPNASPAYDVEVGGLLVRVGTPADLRPGPEAQA